MVKSMRNAIDKIKCTLTNHDIELWEIIAIESVLKAKVLQIDSELHLYNHDYAQLQIDEQRKISHLINSVDRTMLEYEAKLWECIENKAEIQRNLAILKGEQKHSSTENSDFVQNQQLFEPFYYNSDDHIPELNYLEIKLEEKHEIVEPINALSTAVQLAGYSTAKPAIENAEDSMASRAVDEEPKVPAECNVCHKTFNDKYYLKIHKEIHGGRVYDCNICNKVFTTRSRFRYHRKQHVKQGHPIERLEHKCRLCTQKCESVKMLKEHMNLRHDGEKAFRCRHCEQLFDERIKLKEHEFNHIGKYECYMCHRTYADKYFLRKHLKIHWNDSPDRCGDCGKVFMSQSKLRQHIYTNHRREDLTANYLCNECGKCFFTQQQLRIHLPTHSAEKPWACEFCDKSFKQKSTLKFHIENKHTQTDVRYSCDQCAKMFLSKSSMRKHRTVHNRIEELKCPICGKYQPDNHTFKMHTKAHSGVKPFRCTELECNKYFRNTRERTLHVQRVHQKTRPHKCDVCNEGFFNRQQLNIHILEHTGERPFPCGDCASRFKTAGQLKQHKLTAHSDARPYKCNQCDSAFKQSGLLQRHVRGHENAKPYACTRCDARFADSSYINIHMRTHTGEKPYSCEVCGRQFIDQRNMKKHMKIHKNS